MTVHTTSGAGRATRGGRIALAVSGLGYAGMLVWQAVALPDRVPGRVGPGNEVIRWTTKGEHLAFGVLVGALLAATFVLLPRVIDRAPKDMINLPHKSYWVRPENWPRARAMMADDIGWLGAITVVLVGFTMWEVGALARGESVPSWRLLAVVGGYVTVMTAVGLSLSLGPRWRPPRA